jgi:hypothetical protein
MKTGKRERRGIIYYAYNKVSGKYYIGQTVQSLRQRSSAHYSVSRYDRSTNTHFKHALNFYNKDEWEWKTIEECDASMLNERENYWIRKYDSFENGYNCNWGGGQSVIAHKKHKLYHPVHGVVEENSLYFREHYDFKYSTLSQLVTKRAKSAHGWVLIENKDNYYKFIKRSSTTHSIYSPVTGIISGTNKEIKNKVNIVHLHHLTSGRFRMIDGFVLEKDKDDYFEILKSTK